MEQRGSAAILRRFGKKIGGKTHVTGHQLVKKDASSGQTGEVPVGPLDHFRIHPS